MMKRNRLYTVNSWNKPAFMYGSSTNMFPDGGSLASYGYALKTPETISINAPSPTSSGGGGIAGALGGLVGGGGGGIGGALKGAVGAMGGISGIGSAVGGAIGNLIGGGYSSGVGNALGAVGKMASVIPGPWGAAISGGLQVLGGGVNALFGSKVDAVRLGEANKEMSALNSFKSNATSFDDIKGATATKSVADIYKGGVFNKSAAKDQAALEERMAAARQFADRSIGNNIYNLADDQTNQALANYSAFGGELDVMGDNDMGAVNYGFMTDYLNEKKRQNDLKNKMGGMSQMPAFMSNGYALGGDLQMHGGDYTTGLTHVAAGGSHEENPYEGVQMGVDREGTPNLVEEGETVYNDYVFSNRITCDADTKKKFHIGKNRDITYAELSKKLEREISERPNDPISKAAFEAQMANLAENQERQKAEMEAARAREAFEALSPEEQTALMQQVAQQEQMAQEQAIQEQAIAEQAAAEQQPTPEEMAMAQQQQMIQADGSEAALGQAPQMACGGKINRFDKGGVLKFLNSLGYKTVADAEKAGWKPSDFGNYKDWKDINSNSKLSDDFTWTDEFSKRLTSPEQKAMLSLGWNPTAALLSRRWYEGDNGNNVGWTQSYGKNVLNAEEFKDYANRYKNTLGWAVENGLIKAPEGNGTISMADITKAMREAPDWKKTDEWLYSSPANMASYLGMARGLNPDDDTKFINKWSPYGSFTKGTDGNWTYNLRGDLTDAEKQSFTDLFRKARTDNMVGVMYNNFHDPDTVINRYVLDEKGTPVLLTGDDLSGYEQLGTYSWGDETNNMNNNAILYRAKGTGTNGGSGTAGNVGNGTASGSTGDDREVVPIHRNEKLRYAGLFGPAIGLGMQMMGIGKPDTSGIEAAANAGNGPAHLASYQPIGDYMAPKVFDRLFYANQLQANARATDRNLMNTSSGNRGTAMAGLLANGYNTNNNLGNLYRQAEEYNDNRYKQMKEFNRGTNQFNAEAYNRTSQFNADALNRQRQYGAQLAMQAAREKMDADAGWYNGIYGNISGLMKGVGDLGRENAQRNMIADMAANGIFGQMTPSTYVANGMLRYETDEERAKRLANQKRSAAKGGKIKRKKRGLTY